MALPPGSEDPAGLGRVLKFMRLIWALDHGLQRASKKMAAKLGLTGPQRLAIRILGRMEGLTPGGLAEVLHLHPSTLTGILHRLENRGVLRRVPDPMDSRRSFLFLTPEGRKLDVSVRGTIEDAVSRVLAKTTPARLKQTSELLAAMARSLSRISGDTTPRTPGPRVLVRRRSSRRSGRSS